MIRKDGEYISSTESYLYLGVNVDQNLFFDNFLKSIVQKVNCKLYLFSKIWFVLTINAAVQMILPFFGYLDILIDSGPKKYVEKLQLLQFIGIKIIYKYHVDGRKIKSNDEERLHSEIGVQPLKERRKKHVLDTMYNMKTSHPDVIDTRDKGIKLRSSSNVDFKEYKLNNEIYIKSPYVQGYNLWKQLPCNIQHAETLLLFEQMLRDELVLTLQT